MALLGLVSLATSLIAIAVGLRLLRIGLRPRGVPELAIALGFLATYLVGFPVAGASRAPGLVHSAWGTGLLALGVGSALGGVLGIGVFTWRTFRPGSAWAPWWVAWLGVVMAVCTAGVVHAAATTSVGGEEIHAWGRYATLGPAAVYGWTAFEAVREWSRARRRLGIGLGDRPAVARLLLWGLASGATLVTLVVIWIALGREGVVFRMPLFQGAMAVSNAVTGVCWWLAFLPPRAFRAWVSGGAAPA